MTNNDLIYGKHPVAQYPLGHPLVWAARQWLLGEKKGMKLLSFGAVFYKWKYVMELYRAIKKIGLSPLRLAWEVRRDGESRIAKL